MGIQCRIDEAYRWLALRKELLVDAHQDGGKDRCGRGGAADQRRQARIVNDDIVTDGSDVRIATAGAIEDAFVGADIGAVRGLVRRIWGRGVLQVALHGGRLVGGLGVDVAETTAGREASDGDFGVAAGAGARRKSGGSDGRHIWAVNGEGRVEDGAIVQAAVWSGNAGVSRGDDDGDTLQAELHVFAALALLVVYRRLGFVAAIRDRDHVGRLVHTALQLALVAAGSGIWVGRVISIVASDSVGGESAVGAVNRVEKVVQKSRELVVGLVVGIVRLEQNTSLGPDDRVRDLKVQVGFRTSVGDTRRRGGAIDTLQCWVSSLGDIPMFN